MINIKALIEKVKNNKQEAQEQSDNVKKQLLYTLEKNEDKIQEMLLLLCNKSKVNKCRITYDDFWVGILGDLKFIYNAQPIIIEFFKKRKIKLKFDEIHVTYVMRFEW